MHAAMQTAYKTTPERMYAFPTASPHTRFRVIGDRRLEFSTPAICTGTVVSVVNDATGETETTFEIVIFGDVDCDGIFTPNDVTQLRFMNANMTERFADGSAQAMASDVDHDGIFAAPNDYTVLRYAKAGLREISQVV